LEGFPFEVDSTPINREIKPKETFIVKVMIKVSERAVASENVTNVFVRFRNPGGGEFGEPIPLKLKIVQ
jgi:hypothetical protein